MGMALRCVVELVAGKRRNQAGQLQVLVSLVSGSLIYRAGS